MTNSDEPETESEGEGGEDEESDEEQDFCDQFDDPPPDVENEHKDPGLDLEHHMTDLSSSPVVYHRRKRLQNISSSDSDTTTG